MLVRSHWYSIFFKSINAHSATIDPNYCFAENCLYFSSIFGALPSSRVLHFYDSATSCLSSFSPFSDLESICRHKIDLLSLNRGAIIMRENTVPEFQKTHLSSTFNPNASVGMWLWISHLTSLNLSFVICEISIIKMIVMICSPWNCSPTAPCLCFI